MNRRDEFFDFELKNKLFDIVDERGLRPWEAVRYLVYNNVNYGLGKISIPPKRKWVLYSNKFMQLWRGIKSFVSFVFYVICHRHSDVFFLLASRDKINGVVYDGICGNFYELYNDNSYFTFETSNVDGAYKYNGLVCKYDFIKLWNKFPWKGYDYSDICYLLREKFPSFTLDPTDLKKIYKEFYAQYCLYKILFRYCKPQRMCIVQNGIQKGLFAAAHEMGVEVLEFQHGQLSRNHPAYSYPDSKEVTAEKIYHPAKLLTFGSFWHKNRVYPGVENVVIGNNSYFVSKEMPDTLGNKKLLVISNFSDGELLARYVKDVLADDGNFFFYFKLHPNQYGEFDYYTDLFKDYPNVKVVSDGQSVIQLLAKVEAVFLFHSTVAVEALSAGRKVFVFKKSAYLSMDFVFDEPGVYLVENVSDFLSCYNDHCKETLKPRDDIFVPFQPDMALKIFKT